MKTSISTLRHARTAYNQEKRYAGSIDIPLCEQGRREAEEVAPKMKGLAFDAVVTSRLRRAHETARIIMPAGIPVLRTRLCNERNFGIMEGLTWDDVQTLDPPVLMISVGGDQHTVNPRNGEPFEQVWERTHSSHLAQCPGSACIYPDMFDSAFPERPNKWFNSPLIAYLA